MLKIEENEIKEVQKCLLKQLEKVDKLDDPVEALQRINVLWDINRYLENYEELKPVLQKFFIQKAKKNKWKNKEDGRYSVL